MEDTLPSVTGAGESVRKGIRWQVAREFGVGWGIVMAADVEYGTPLVADPDRLGVDAVGVDETAFLAANAKHPTMFVTGVVDVRRPRLLDVVPGRSGTVLAQWIPARPVEWRQQVQVARRTRSAATPQR